MKLTCAFNMLEEYAVWGLGCSLEGQQRCKHAEKAHDPLLCR